MSATAFPAGAAPKAPGDRASGHFSALLRFWARRLPDHLAVRFAEREYTCYGQTEFAGGYATLLYEDEAHDHVGSVGRVVMHHEIRIVDAADNDVPTGEPGQILLRGPSVMTGYWRRPE